LIKNHSSWHLTLAGVCLALGISHWLVCSTPHTMTPQTVVLSAPLPCPWLYFYTVAHTEKAMSLTTFFFSQQWDRACGKRFPSIKPDWVPSIDDRAGHFCMDHLSRYKTIEPRMMLRHTGQMMIWCSPPFTPFNSALKVQS
jgi:hypothetical protein